MWDFLKEHIIETLFITVSSAIGIWFRKIQKRIKCDKEERELSKIALQALLRNEIVRSFNEHIDKKYCSIHDRENVEAMYNVYVSLGGNGTVKGLYKRLMELPTRPPEK